MAEKETEVDTTEEDTIFADLKEPISEKARDLVITEDPEPESSRSSLTDDEVSSILAGEGEKTEESEEKPTEKTAKTLGKQPEPEEKPETEAPNAQETPKEKKEEKTEELWEVKVNGVSSKKPRSEIIKGYQLAQASFKALQEAAEEKKAALFVTEEIIRDPKKAIFDLMASKGISDEQAEREWYKWLDGELGRITEEAKLSPEAQQMAAQTRRIQRHKEKLERERDQLAEDIAKHRFSRMGHELREAMIAAGLPTTPELVQEAAHILRKSVEDQLDISVEEAVSMVKQKRDEGAERLAKTLSARELIERFPDIIEVIENKKRPTAKTPTKVPESRELEDIIGGQDTKRRQEPRSLSQADLHRQLQRKYRH